MATFEYKTICAPRKALKIKGVKSSDERYAQTLTDVINAQSADGWEYFRAEALPVDERSGMSRRVTEKYLSLLIFRRENIETYEEPSLSGDVEDEIQPTMVEAPLVEEEEVVAEVGSLGPATR
ncbi:MAG: DUF4177 domain-containing protein [Paracoccaceae bacterium]|jgi:hypothetical protein